MILNLLLYNFIKKERKRNFFVRLYTIFDDTGVSEMFLSDNRKLGRNFDWIDTLKYRRKYQ